MKKNKKQNKGLYTIIGTALSICLIGLIIIWIMFGEPWKISNFKEMRKVDVDDYKEKSGEYYVFVYNKQEDLFDEYETKIVEYANYSRNHKNALRIYFLDYSKAGNSKIKNEFTSSSSNVTRLLKIKDNNINSEKVTWSNIFNELEESK